MKALVIGATGATGKDLVKVLLSDERYAEVVIFVRRPGGMQHPKLKEILTDFNDLDGFALNIDGDILFSCLGTTLKIAGSKEQQRLVDLELPLKFAQIARSNGVAKTVLLSAYGAARESRMFYSRLKGELEESIVALAFAQTIIFRPGLLLREDTDRLGERIAAGFLKAANTIGLLKSFRPLPTRLLSQKMAKAPFVFSGGKHVVSLKEIFEL